MALPIRWKRHYKVCRTADRFPERHAVRIPRIVHRIAVVIAIVRARHDGFPHPTGHFGNQDAREVEKVFDGFRNGRIGLNSDGKRGLKPLNGDRVLETAALYLRRARQRRIGKMKGKSGIQSGIGGKKIRIS